MGGHPSWENTNAEEGTPHQPVERVPDIATGGPASQYTHHERMPEAFGAACIESAPRGLMPRATAAQPGKIEPGREAPRVLKPQKPAPHDDPY
jgi:hypothetical protein